MVSNRTLARTAVLTLLAAGVVACSTTTAGHGQLDAASGPVRIGSSSAGLNGTGSDPSTASPSPTVSLDVDSERRVTCLLVLPSLAKVIIDWNNYVDHKSDTRDSVAASLSSTATLIDTLLEHSGLTGADPVRSMATRLSADLNLMAQTLRRGATPPVSQFNVDKRQFQVSCPK